MLVFLPERAEQFGTAGVTQLQVRLFILFISLAFAYRRQLSRVSLAEPMYI